MYLSVAEAGRLLLLTPAGVRRLAKEKILKTAAKTEGGMRLFTRADVDALARQRHAAASTS